MAATAASSSGQLPPGARQPEAPIAEAFDHLKIAVRERPLSEAEKAATQVVLRTDDDRLIAFYPDSKEGLVYNYDYFFPEEATQIDVFQTIGAEMVELMMNGYSASCVSFGPSATGKTHTLFGSDQEPGLIQLATKELFQRMSADAGRSYEVKLAYWEMNGDHIVDALGSTDATAIQTGAIPAPKFSLQKDMEYGGIMVAGLNVIDIASWDELDEFIMQGNIRRIQEAERRNARWHGFVRLFVTSVDRASPEVRTWCRLTFAHLKGADRVGQKGARGDVLKQGSAINKSISLLLSSILHSVDFRRRALQALDQPTEDQVREVMERSESFFHETKFTQVLAHALCGLEASFMIGTVCALDYHDTTDTLENLQNAQQLISLLRRRQNITEFGHLKRQLAVAEANVPVAEVAPGHPLTELEEKVEDIRRRLGDASHTAEATLAAKSPRKRKEDEARERAASAPRVAPIPPAHIPSHLQRWKQGVLKGKMHGDRATVYIPAGSKSKKHTYKGQWAHGCKEGFGTHETGTAKYEGYFRAGLRHGEGTLWVRPDQKSQWTRVYRGTWQEDQRHGRGSAWYPNGDMYDGFFEHDQRSAIGKLFLANGDRVEGQFRNDVVDGWATLHRKNGDWFEGHWENGMREGKGVWYYESKKQIYRGEWHRDGPKFGIIEDMPSKEDHEASRYVPRVDLLDTEAVLAKEKMLLDLHRRRLTEEQELAAQRVATAPTGHASGTRRDRRDDTVSW